MIAEIHIAFASSLHLGGAALFEYETCGMDYRFVRRSLLPDTDLSKLARVLFWLSTRLEKAFCHRTLTHSEISRRVQEGPTGNG